MSEGAVSGDVWPGDTKYAREWLVQKVIAALRERGASRNCMGDYICSIVIGDELAPEPGEQLIPYTTPAPGNAGEPDRTILHASRVSPYRIGDLVLDDSHMAWEVIVSDCVRRQHFYGHGFMAVLLLRKVPTKLLTDFT